MKKKYAVPTFIQVVILVGLSMTADAASSGRPKNSKTKCSSSGFETSICIVQAILEDVEKTHTDRSGGGISEIKALATLQYRVRLPRNEAVDIITYDFETTKEGRVRIAKREVGVETMGRVEAESDQKKEFVVVFKKDVKEASAEKIMKSFGVEYKPGMDQSKSRLYFRSTGPKFVVRVAAEKADAFKSEASRRPDVDEVYVPNWKAMKD